MSKIETLTPAQEISLREHHAKWFAIGSSTERADRPRAEAAIAQMYREISKEPPFFIWCESPGTSVMAISTLKNADSLEASLWDSLEDSLGSSLEASLWDSLEDSLGSSLEASLRASLRNSLWDSLGASLGASLRNSLWASLWASLRVSLRDSLEDSRFWGAQDAYWIAYYLFSSTVLGVRFNDTEARHLSLWSDIAQSCGWWWPYDGLCIVSERPTAVHWEAGDRPRIHCENGPAIAFADGWNVHAWHGTRVPSEWIENKDSLDVKKLLAHENIETRRAGLEIVGWDRVLRELDATVVDANTDPQIGTLLRVDLPDAPGSQFLKVKCGTGRNFAIPVPEGIKTALEGNAWTYGLQPHELQLEQRT